MSLLLDALKRAESKKKHGDGATDNLSGAIPDIDFSAIDPVALQRNGAKNLFNAKLSGYDGYSKAKLIALLGGTALLLGAAGFYAWYWYSTSVRPGSQISLNSRALPNPAGATPPVAAVNAPAQTQPTPDSVISTPAPQPPEVLPTTAPAVADNSAKTPAAMPAQKMPQQKKPATTTKGKPPRVVTAVAPRPPANSARQVTGATPLPAPPMLAQSAASISPLPAADESIRLRRSTEEIFAISPELGAAYQALVAGNVADARQKYESVLQKDPANIDAELGLATIAAKNGNPAEAARRYKRVLELSPKNPYAIAGNAALVNDLPQTENQLRAQIAQQPQSAPLIAALGNIFAAQGRWNEAQQAYFDAARLDGNHPDYAFNLAVSLDQINQPKLALENYQKALALANMRPGQFSKDAVAARIAELSRIR
ncbi:MAG: tetratricopeptide repeat protein [Burkholderiales bacterium]